MLIQLLVTLIAGGMFAGALAVGRSAFHRFLLGRRARPRRDAPVPRPPGRKRSFVENPSAPPGPEPFTGKGVCLEFQVADARAEYARFEQGGADRPGAADQPFGQQRFGLFDPAGVWIDVVEQIESAPAWWDPYLESP